MQCTGNGFTKSGTFAPRCTYSSVTQPSDAGFTLLNDSPELAHRFPQSGPDADPGNPLHGDYLQAVGSHSISFSGGTVRIADIPSAVELYLDSGGQDRYRANGLLNGVGAWNIDLFDSSATALASDALVPPTPLTITRSKERFADRASTWRLEKAPNVLFGAAAQTVASASTCPARGESKVVLVDDDVLVLEAAVEDVLVDDVAVLLVVVDDVVLDDDEVVVVPATASSMIGPPLDASRELYVTPLAERLSSAKQ